jgi:hypothetical protein
VCSNLFIKRGGKKCDFVREALQKRISTTLPGTEITFFILFAYYLVG